jgi:hypothetical protein
MSAVRISENDKHIAFRAPSEHIERLREMAREQDVSASELLRQALERLVSEHAPKRPRNPFVDAARRSAR